MNLSARKIINTLKGAGYSAEIVGGAVRDYLLGNIPNDIDIATSASPQTVMTLFPKVVPSGLAFGTVTVLDGEDGFEITTYRADGEYLDGRRPSGVYFSESLTEDLARRDFTINAMAMTESGEIIDPFRGADDLKNKILRAVGNAEDRIAEDALRILRAVRFASRYDMSIHQELFDACKKNASSIRNVSNERILTELIKTLRYGSSGIKILQKMGVLAHILPEVNVLVGCSQDNPYHQYDAFHHTLVAIDNTPVDDVVRMAMLFHDCGKPTTKVFDGERDTFLGHVELSAAMASEALKRLKASNSFTDNVIELILYHDMEVVPTAKSVRRMKSKLKHSTIEQLLDVKLADTMGQSLYAQSKKLHVLYQIRDIVSTPECMTITTKDLAINGHDLMKRGMKGPEIGQTLRDLLDIVIDNPQLNDKDTLMNMI